MRTSLTAFLVVVLALTLHGCGDAENSCSPIGFLACEGNDLLTCVGDEGANSGTLDKQDCTETGLVCAETLTASYQSVASCTKPTVGDACHEKNTTSCTQDDEIVRCVWVSEQPAAGLSGDIGAWRVETACQDTGRVCTATAGGGTCTSGS